MLKLNKCYVMLSIYLFIYLYLLVCNHIIKLHKLDGNPTCPHNIFSFIAIKIDTLLVKQQYLLPLSFDVLLSNT